MADRLHLLLGDDDFLAGRVISAVAEQVRADAGEQVPVTRIRAGDVTENELAEMLSPSLFAEERIIALEAAAEAGKEPAAVIMSTATQLPDGVTLLVAHNGAGRAKAMVPALRKAGAVEHDCVAPKWPEQKAKFVQQEFRNLGVKVSGAIADQMVQSVGGELRELAAACSQLVADTGGKVDAAAVALYYSGRPEVTGFEIADQTVTGNRAGAQESLAWALHHGVPRVVLADALAEAVHGIARVRSLGSVDPYSAASEVGMPPTRVKKLQAQARAWDSDSIAQALVIVAALNADVKGQAADADFSLELAVARIAELRPSRARR